MLLLIASLLVASSAIAAPCRLVGQPWLEARLSDGRLVRSVDAKLGERVPVFVAAPAELDGKRVVLGDGGTGRVPLAEVKPRCGEPQIAWRRIEPLMEHTHTRSPNTSVTVYANAVVFGPKHGTWIGYDRLEYVETPLPDGGPSLVVEDARPSASIAMPERPADFARLGVMHLAATITLAGTSASTPGIDRRDRQLDAATFRYTFRTRDDFLGWLTTFFNVPYLFGSAGKGARAQAERYVGADCADVLVAALRRSGLPLEYSSVAELVGKLPRIAGPVELPACAPETRCATTPLRYGREVQPGDLVALDYVTAEELPRAWDHIVSVVEDRGPGDAPDGLLGPEDLVADIGDRAGLKLARLGDQGHIRLVVLRAQARSGKPRP